jgi:hypothetical protein
MRIGLLLEMFLTSLALKAQTIPRFNAPPKPRQFSSGNYDSINNQLLLFGGMPESGNSYADTWAFSFSDQKWTEVTSTTSKTPGSCYVAGQKCHGSFVDEAGRVLYIFGGESDLGFLNDMLALSLKTLTVRTSQWSEVAQAGDVPTPVASFAYTTYFDKGNLKFVLCRGAGLFETLNDVYVYPIISFDVPTKRWTVHPGKGTRPKAERDSAIVYYEDALYHYGGYKEEDNRDPSLAETKLYRYDLKLQVWTEVKVRDELPNRGNFGMAVYNHNLFIFLGWNTILFGQREVYKLQLKSSVLAWEEVKYTNDRYDLVMPYDSYAFDFKGSTAYFDCGWNRDELNNNISTVDLSLGVPLTFQYVTDFFVAPAARQHHKLAVIGTHLLMFGGEGKHSK